MYIIVLSAGILSGLLLLHLIKRAIFKRTGMAPNAPFLTATGAPAVWAAVNAWAWLSIYHFFGINLYTVELVCICSICMVISVVDYTIRRIPNEALLSLALVAIIGLFVQSTWGYTLDHLLGLFLGLGIFMIPFLIKKQAGAGDIKFAAVIGLYLGLYHTVVALVVMSLLLLVYIVALIVSGKGNLKSSVALGPYMSVGLVVTIALL